MARIKFNSNEGNTGGSTWVPLPDGDYDIMIDDVMEKVASTGNPQLQIKGHVVGGAHEGSKVTIFRSLLPQAAFNLEAMLNAALMPGQYDKVETGEVRVNKASGKEEPIFEFEFDTDDLIGVVITWEVSQREYPIGSGKWNNEFSLPRGPGNTEEAAPAPAAVARPAQRPAAAPARQAAPAAQPARQQAVAQPARRVAR